MKKRFIAIIAAVLISTAYAYCEKAIIIDEDGQVGIGTSGPATALEVNGDLKAESLTSSGTLKADQLHILRDGKSLFIVASGKVFVGILNFLKQIADYDARLIVTGELKCRSLKVEGDVITRSENSLLAPSTQQSAQFQSSVIPQGMIALWQANNTLIPTGWIACNGQDGAPDLRNGLVMGLPGSETPGPAPTPTGTPFLESYGVYPLIYIMKKDAPTPTPTPIISPAETPSGTPVPVRTFSPSAGLVMRDGKIGIGTYSPDEMLDVAGDLKAHAISVDSITTRGLDVGEHDIVTAGGKVGIGTDSPQADLDVSGKISADTVTVNGPIEADSFSTSKGKVDIIPPGFIVIWSGPTDPGSIPAGWALCDGTYDTPNLTNNFVIGYSGTGGKTYAQSNALGLPYSPNGVNEPTMFYKLAYIMKLPSNMTPTPTPTISNTPTPTSSPTNTPTPTIVPGSRGQALFIVGASGVNMAADDTAVKNRLTAMGFTVVPMYAGSCDTSQANGKTLIVITATGNPDSILDKFCYVSQPVMIYKATLFDNMAMTRETSGYFWGGLANQTTLQIVNPAHPMAAGLSETVTVSGPANYTWGMPPTDSGAILIAKLTDGTSHYGIFGYDKGAKMAYGQYASGRRVGFVIGGDVAVSFNQNGWKLFEAAVNWLTGKI